MTQAQQTLHRPTVFTSAIVAAAIALAITVSGLVVALNVVAPAGTPFDAASDERLDRAERAGLEWQERYEQMYPTR